MDPWFVAFTSSIPVAAIVFIQFRRWRDRARARQATSGMDQSFS